MRYYRSQVKVHLSSDSNNEHKIDLFGKHNTSISSRNQYHSHKSPMVSRTREMPQWSEIKDIHWLRFQKRFSKYSSKDHRKVRQCCCGEVAFISDADILLYTSTDGDCATLTNADEAWSEAKVVICSPTIIYGVDYNNKDHSFTTVMGHYRLEVKHIKRWAEGMITFLRGSSSSWMGSISLTQEDRLFRVQPSVLWNRKK